MQLDRVKWPIRWGDSNGYVLLEVSLVQLHYFSPDSTF